MARTGFIKFASANLYFNARESKLGLVFGYLVAVSLLLGLTGCGYTLTHRVKRVFAQGTEGLFVPVFVNLTNETGAEMVFTNALIRELASRNQFRLVERGEAKLELRGTVRSIKYEPASFTELGFGGLQPGYRRLPSNYAVDVIVGLVLIELASNKQLWAKEFAGHRRVAAPLDRTYSFEAASSVGLLTQSVIETSYGIIARIIMRDVYDEMNEIF